MKLRVRGNSIRLRLTQGEVEALANQHVVEERTELEGGTFGYAILTGDGVTRASFVGGVVTVTVPRSEALALATTDRVAIEAESRGVRILVEKDFTCVTPRGEEDHDTFPNPNAAC